jgi:hypothetical protein
MCHGKPEEPCLTQAKVICYFDKTSQFDLEEKRKENGR